MTTLPPAQLWGLDPVFRSHAKLYIQDLIRLQRVHGNQGIFQYGSHPIVRVDVLGVLVRLEERSKFFSYTLDDGTGVISCTVWKPQDSHGSADQHSVTDHLCPELLLKLKETQQKETSTETFQLGALLHVRGKLRVFRESIQLISTYCCQIDDPNTETERMLLLPKLYRECYNQPSAVPRSLSDAMSQGGIEQITLVYNLETAVQDYCSQTRIKQVTKDDLLDIERVQSLLESHPSHAQDTLDQALNNLMRAGHIFEKEASLGCSITYLVTAVCLELEEAVLTTIRVWCDKQQGTGDEGCPIDHIFHSIQKLPAFIRLGHSALCQCVEKLECQSDIISTSEKRYVTFSDGVH